ncbi:Uncharacterized protein Fot_50991 [Forsythia ovata]|uniref:Uncharacterized protein n=1 Tax=Forsythia ovata TaxID=205694 RepID=A0ABD1PU55_9LAMI
MGFPGTGKSFATTIKTYAAAVVPIAAIRDEIWEVENWVRGEESDLMANDNGEDQNKDGAIEVKWVSGATSKIDVVGFPFIDLATNYESFESFLDLATNYESQVNCNLG